MLHRSLAALGDLVGSRRARDRAALQRRLEAALAAVNERVPALEPLTPTIGDEFQARYAGVAAALRASLLVRLHLLPEVDVRFGLGWGHLVVHDPQRAPLGQEGPAWWAARDALDAVAAAARTPGAPPGWRTCLRVAPAGDDAPDRDHDAADEERVMHAVPEQAPTPGGAPGRTAAEPRPDRAGPLTGSDLPVPEEVVNAHLVCRDALVAGMDARDARLTLGLLEGRSQRELAAAEGISPSAVSQRVRRSGALAVVRADAMLAAGLPEQPPGGMRPAGEGAGGPAGSEPAGSGAAAGQPPAGGGPGDPQRRRQ